MDVAKNWGDEFIYAIMYAKTFSVTAPAEKKGKMAQLRDTVKVM